MWGIHFSTLVLSVNWFDWWLMDVARLEASKDCDMKKKLLVLLIAAASTMMPNMASAVAIELPPEVGGHLEPLEGKINPIMRCSDFRQAAYSWLIPSS